jgi:NADH:ubiquinone oxidoreductase subunit 6 (subunit J)
MPIGDSIPFTTVRWDDFLFVVLAGALLISALMVVTLRDIIRSGLALTASFAALAGIYVLLGSPIVAATQVLVYIGAVSVLILFAIMLTQTKNAPARLVFQTQVVAAAAAAIVIAIVIGATVLATAWPDASQRMWTSTEQAALMLFRENVLPFEIVSVLLTAAVVGAVYLARRGNDASEEDR